LGKRGEEKEEGERKEVGRRNREEVERRAKELAGVEVDNLFMFSF
jgi:hypothetical protein